ncbi:Disease resistance protein (CC-NBS-LRR class) family [Rhynchospora pubera]|uniref:Disease resistance protein (CC-NBS-LRR class) family n=1 Tax=Rhynchospora pubera TaxID=906938 RepID=A0AAV8EDT1_9POAL|nr:Disease resistance protein (CC-NBS-LRR class) family [Rhynchospora pubera]
MATAATIALAGLRVIASPVMKRLVDKGFSYVGMDVPNELKDLVDRVLPQLAIATKASEEIRMDMPELKAWLQKLKDTYDDAEDILDEVEYQTITKKIKHEKRAFMEYGSVVGELLKEPDSSENKLYSVVAIVGIGGAGKTTLAQHIYHDPDVEKHFDMRMWVSLTRKLDVIKHTKAMIESASLSKEHPQSSTLEALHSILVETLSRSKKVLVVLDDLWYNKSEEDDWCNKNEDEEWKRLLAPFNSISGSTTILLTSRSEKLPGLLGNEKIIIKLRKLTNDVSIALFRHYACLDKMHETPLKNELEEISLQIVQNLPPFPLAIESVALQLRGQREKVLPKKNVLG